MYSPVTEVPGAVGSSEPSSQGTLESRRNVGVTGEKVAGQAVVRVQAGGRSLLVSFMYSLYMLRHTEGSPTCTALNLADISSGSG